MCKDRTETGLYNAGGSLLGREMTCAEAATAGTCLAPRPGGSHTIRPTHSRCSQNKATATSHAHWGKTAEPRAARDQQDKMMLELRLAARICTRATVQDYRGAWPKTRKRRLPPGKPCVDGERQMLPLATRRGLPRITSDRSPATLAGEVCLDLLPPRYGDPDDMVIVSLPLPAAPCRRGG